MPPLPPRSGDLIFTETQTRVFTCSAGRVCVPRLDVRFLRVHQAKSCVYLTNRIVVINTSSLQGGECWYPKSINLDWLPCVADRLYCIHSE